MNILREQAMDRAGEMDMAPMRRMDDRQAPTTPLQWPAPDAESLWQDRGFLDLLGGYALAHAQGGMPVIDAIGALKDYTIKFFEVPAAAAQTACAVPPPEWNCTRAAGHDGPCAAHPANNSGAAVRGEPVAEELREIDTVLAENDRLREALADKISGETLLTEFNMNRGGLNMQFEGGACQMLAEQFAQQFREMGGDNYIEIGFTARSDGMPLLVTIQRVSGKTPATLKTEAEAKLATAKNFHRSLCDRFGYSHDDRDWLRDLVSLEEFIAAKVSPRAADAPSEPSRLELVPQDFIDAVKGARGELDAWLEVNSEAECRSIFKEILRAADALDSQPTEPYKLESNEQYNVQTAAIGAASFGYCTLDGIKPEYMTQPLRDMVALYEKYAALDSRASSAPVAPIAPDGWISVYDELPEHRQTVAFVVDTGDWPRMSHLNGRVLGGQFDGSTGNFSVPGLGVIATHWMPLPPAPRQEGSEAGNGRAELAKLLIDAQPGDAT